MSKQIIKDTNAILERQSNAFVDNFNEAWELKKSGGKVIWSSSGGHNEILRPMGYAVCLPEVYGMILASAGMSDQLCKITDSYGYSSDLCSIIRCFQGWALSDPPLDPQKLPFGGFPEPDALYCAAYCPGLYKIWQELARVYNVPLHVVEHPWVNDLDVADPSIMEAKLSQDIAGMKEELAFYEDIIGKKLTDQELKDIAVKERDVSVLWHDILRMNMHKPAPMSFFDLANIFTMFQFYKGTDDALTYYAWVKEEVQKRIDNHYVSMPEKYRVWWFGNPVGFAAAKQQKKMEELEVVPVMSQWCWYFGNEDMDVEDPIRAICQYSNCSPLQFRGTRYKIDEIARMVTEYGCDGIICVGSRTCQVCTVDNNEILEQVAARTGLPFVKIETDMADESFYSEEEFNAAIDSLVEMMEQRRR
ncbi:MAG: 2-hydroxyacyl-CoA dehydratase family protein [Lachnospiraceae bacterium]|nr:2-hydroxyacyl-CoA dehydratase family protein [Lachnospiraceae bacterium]